jgi:outer membrane assembly lipoprotein YfiO
MRYFLSFFLLGVIFLAGRGEGEAFWIWTPETNKWVNPKFEVKETPYEQLDYAKGYYDRKEYKKAIGEFQKLIKHYPKAREAADAQYFIGRSQEDQGGVIQAFKAYQTAIEKYPFSERAGEIIKRQYDIGVRLMDGKIQRNRVMSAVGAGNYDVIDVFRKVIKNAPYGEYAAPAQYKIGLYLQEQGLYQEARDEFEKTVNDYPESEWAKAARYRIALSDSQRSSDAQYDQKVTESAIQEFKAFVKDYPDAELSGDARDQIQQLKEKEAENNFLVAQYYEKRKQYQSAKIYYTTIVEDYRNTSWSAKSLERLQQINRINP